MENEKNRRESLQEMELMEERITTMLAGVLLEEDDEKVEQKQKLPNRSQSHLSMPGVEMQPKLFINSVLFQGPINEDEFPCLESKQSKGSLGFGGVSLNVNGKSFQRYNSLNSNKITDKDNSSMKKQNYISNGLNMPNMGNMSNLVTINNGNSYEQFGGNSPMMSSPVMKTRDLNSINNGNNMK